MDPLVTGLYEAAADERRWPQLLQALDESFDTVASWLLVFRGRTVVGIWATGALRELATVGMAHCVADADWESAPSLAYCLHHPTQAFADFDDYFPPDVVARDSMLQRMVQGGLHYVTGAVLQVPDGLAVLNLCRPTAARWSPGVMARLDALHPHLAQAVQLGMMLSQLPAERMCQTLQGLNRAAAVLAHHGVVMATNAAFEQHLADWARLDANRRLQAHVSECQQQLQWALALDKDVAVPPFETVGTSGQGLQLQLLHLHGVTRDCFMGGRKLLVVQLQTPAATGGLPADGLRRRYGLSGKQAQLAQLLASGNSLRQAADALALSYASARTYLQRIYSHTGVRRQVDLVRLVLGRLDSAELVTDGLDDAAEDDGPPA